MRGTPKLSQRGAYYYITFSEGRRSKRYSTGTADREQAENILAQYLIERRKPTLTDADELLVNDMLDRYVEDSGKETAVWHLKHLKPFFADVHLSQLSRPMIRQYTKERLETAAVRGKQKSKRFISPSTVRRELNTLTSALNYYHKEGLSKEAMFIEKPDAMPARKRWLTTEEFNLLYQAAKSDHIRTYLMLAINTAARPSSILELKWSQVDMQKRLIDFNATDRIQTEKHRPIVGINTDLFNYLAQQRRNSPYIVHFNGDPVKAIKKAFKAACEFAGLSGVTPYVLRHTALTWIVQAGKGLWQAGQVAGHKDPRTTARYTHHDPEHTRDAVEAIGVQLAHNSAKSGKNEKNTANRKVNIQ